MRSSRDAVKKFIKEFDSSIEAALKEAGKLAKEDKRNTVMDQDIAPALEKHLGKKTLNLAGDSRRNYPKDTHRPW